MIANRAAFAFSVILVGLILSIPLIGQQTVSVSAPRDIEAITILNQAMSASGGLAALGNINDVTSTGTITFFWAGEQLSGTAVLKRRGFREFRIDTTLPDGTRSWIVNNGVGTYVDVDGTVRLDTRATAFGMGFPYMSVLAGLADKSVGISYIGLEARVGASVHHIRIGGGQKDPNALLNGYFNSAKDLYIDSTSLHLLSVVDQVHLRDNLAIQVPREVQFSNYQVVTGILIASTVNESIYGQPTLTLQLNQTTFNTGLTDTDFQN